MTGEKIYFQWQNPILRKTIYPVREMKLRHFLLYFMEVDLWEKYRKWDGLPVENLPKEKKEYEDAQKLAIRDAFINERSLKAYFTNDAPEVEDDSVHSEVVKLNDLLIGLHYDFRAFY